MLVQEECAAKIRSYDLKKDEKTSQQNAEDSKKNRNFTQVYPRGWRRIIDLAQKNPGASTLYAFFAQHLDPSCGAVICDQAFLATHFEVTTRTIRNWSKFLEEEEAIVRIPVSGRVYAYALDPHEVWKGYENTKSYASFLTRTLVNKDNEVQRRIMSMFKKIDSDDDES